MAKKSKSRKSSPPAKKHTSHAKQEPINHKDIRNLKNIQEKYNYGIKRPAKELQSIKKELQKERRPIYYLNAKLRDAETRYQKGKIKKQINQLTQQSQGKINALVEKRQDIKQLKKYSSILHNTQQSSNRAIQRYDKLIAKAEENTDWKEVERLTYQKIKKMQEVDDIKSALGKKFAKIDVSGYESRDDSDRSGYLEDPANPYPIWQAIEQFNRDLYSGTWDFIIVNGKRISTKNPILLSAEASQFWISVKGVTGTRTPYVLRFYNLKKKTVKYTSY